MANGEAHALPPPGGVGGGSRAQPQAAPPGAARAGPLAPASSSWRRVWPFRRRLPLLGPGSPSQKYFEALERARKHGLTSKAPKKPGKSREERKLVNIGAHHRMLRRYLDLAGFEHLSEKRIFKGIINTAIMACLLATAVILINAGVRRTGVAGPAVFLAGIWTAMLAALVVLSFVAVYVFLDLKIFNRTLALEAVLPDYLQLVATNISAGMTIDRALWFAVRPHFGVLAKEIEEVAKATLAGESLNKALQSFSAKYSSKILKESINLLLEGLASGGEMSDLLNKIAVNIQETRIMRREMAANVTTYMIFITFATVVAAPFLFALSTALLGVIVDIMGKLDVTQSVGGMSFNFKPENISITSFKIFCIVTLLVSSFFSACIISIIRRGNIKEGLRYIPIFMVTTVALYLLGVMVMTQFTKLILPS